MNDTKSTPAAQAGQQRRVTRDSLHDGLVHAFTLLALRNEDAAKQLANELRLHNHHGNLEAATWIEWAISFDAPHPNHLLDDGAWDE